MKKVLIIDDDQVFQKTMTTKLKELSFDVANAYDGEEGLTKAISEKPDLMLLDIKMPKLDGISLLTKLRADKTVPNIPVLITSNMSGMDQISEGVTLGVKGYIVKSDETLDSIVTEVQSVLNPKA